MFAKNRVIWNEGLFIKPQHFQQQQRHNEYYVSERVRTIGGQYFGISELVFNPDYLAFGRLAIERAVGVMPDGTVFHIPQEDSLPKAIEIPSGVTNLEVFLAIPLHHSTPMTEEGVDPLNSGRYDHRRLDVMDIYSTQNTTASLEVAPIRAQLMLGHEDRSAYTSLSIGRIVEKRPDGSIVMDPAFLPCHVNVVNQPFLHQAIHEISGLIRERAKGIAQRINLPSQGSVAEVSDFLLLQALNRLQPQLAHLLTLNTLHPERLFECLTMLVGELATFTDEKRLPPSISAYQHENPTAGFQALLRSVRQSLSVVLDPKAVSIQIEKRQYGLMVAPIQDRHLMENADFILAVRANMPQNDLRHQFPHQTKISSVEHIRERIALQLPGIPLVALPVAPRHLPYHAGYLYYQLDKSSHEWETLIDASGFAFHVAAAFDGLELQLWAIRN